MMRNEVEERRGRLLYDRQRVGNRIEVRDVRQRLLGYCQMVRPGTFRASW